MCVWEVGLETQRLTVGACVSERERGMRVSLTGAHPPTRPPRGPHRVQAVVCELCVGKTPNARGQGRKGGGARVSTVGIPAHCFRSERHNASPPHAAIPTHVATTEGAY